MYRNDAVTLQEPGLLSITDGAALQRLSFFCPLQLYSDDLGSLRDRIIRGTAARVYSEPADGGGLATAGYQRTINPFSPVREVTFYCPRILFFLFWLFHLLKSFSHFLDMKLFLTVRQTFTREIRNLPLTYHDKNLHLLLYT